MMIAILKLLISVVAVVLFTWIENLINSKKNRRARQALMVVIGVVYCAGTYFLALHWRDRLSFISGLVGFLNNTEILIMNMGIIISFIFMKLIVRPILTGIWKKKELIEATSASFYVYDEEYDEWFLKKQWINFRKFIFAMICGMTFACGLFIGITWLNGFGSHWWVVSAPITALIVVTEIYGFINGLTKEEYEYVIFGENAHSWKVSKFFKLREIFEKILRGPILSAHTGCEFSNTQSPQDIIDELNNSDNQIDRITADYFWFEDRYKKADVDSLQATIDMMHRRNVLFFNPFYKDLGMYITLPLINALLSGKKCLIVVGRMSQCDDVKQWVEELLKDYSRMKSLWKVGLLSDIEPVCEVGILSFPQFYDKRVITANRKFFAETDFVGLFEPSVIVNTGQVALSIIAREIHMGGDEPVYCICDRKVNGLVDTLSHLLRTEITNVVAPPVPRCIYSGLVWDADGDYIRQKLFGKQTKFLGNGIEIAAVAVKNQVPKVSWYSEKKVPLKDVKWIAGQYYPNICRYMNLPTQQKNLYEKIEFVSNLWSAPMVKEQFIIVEDEFSNMFSSMRAYLSRGIDQSFVNVMSGNYLLRDYMRCNKQMFMTNPDAIPSIVSDYAKTERNTLIKLILMMVYRPVMEDEIENEFRMVGIEAGDALGTMSRMLRKYTFADESIITIKSVRRELDEITSVTVCSYRISEAAFDEYFADSLKSAYYIIEDEIYEKGYIDSKLFNHVTQTILPGQYVTYDGKYYVAKHISPESGCILRRAADSYDRRLYYRQLRSYCIEESGELISTKKIMDMELSIERCNFSVRTNGYLEMPDNKDLRHARHIDLSSDPKTGSFTRHYKNKAVLSITLPETDIRQRYTITILLAEMFRSIFPDAWQYLAVLSAHPESGEEAMLNKFNYDIEGKFDENKIYIIEDSDMDLGLLESVENNLMNFFEIMSDYISWHFEQMRQSASKDPLPENPEEKKPQYKIEPAERRKNVFSRLAKRIMELFTVNKNDKDEMNGGENSKPEDKNDSIPADETSIEETVSVDTDNGDIINIDDIDSDEIKPNEEMYDNSNIEKITVGQMEEDKTEDELADSEMDNNRTEEIVEPNQPLSRDSGYPQENINIEPLKTHSDEPKEEDEAEIIFGRLDDDIKTMGDKTLTNTEPPSDDEMTADTEESLDAEISADRENTSVCEDVELERNSNEDDTVDSRLPRDEQIIVHTDGEDLFSVDGVPDDLDLLMPVKASRYQQECFLKFGFDEIDSRLVIEDVNSYLIARGWGNSALKRARKRTELDSTLIDTNVENHCDFCGMPLSGVSYEKLIDGRSRCNDCSMSAINSVADLKQLFARTETMMEIIYNIAIHVPIAIKTTDARTIARHSGQIFVPSTKVASRVLGFAQRKRNKYSLFLENGSPRLCAIDTITHELTHIWQYINWKDSQFNAIYGMNNKKCSAIASDIVYEGMAMWAAIQMLYTMGENYFAQKQEAIADQRTDVYGLGFMLFKDQYGLERGGDNPQTSPFASFPPIDPLIVKAAVKNICKEEECKC